MKKKLCFIAQFPPPIHGLSKAVDILYNSKLKDEFEFEKIDLTNNMNFIKNLIKVCRSNADLFYFTISQTRKGNVRDLVILKVLQWKNKRCLIHLHGGYYRKLIDEKIPKWQKKANYKTIKNLEGVIVLSKALKYIFEGMIDSSKIFVVSNCIENKFLLTNNEVKEKIKESKSKAVKDILYLSNFIKEKGYEYVLQLAKLEKENWEKTKKKKNHFHFAGKFFSNKEKKEFFEYINKNELDNFVTYYGVVDGEVKEKLLRKADIFILLTAYAKEGQPISILEAMGSGMVIVTTNHAGIPDIVKNNKNGIVVKKNEIKISKLYNELRNINFEVIMKNNSNDIKEYLQARYIDNMNKLFKELSKQ
ncbi:MAG: glycosyltransferase family 4 protein [Clostridia bacterium]|nr:glycosyltransferase family 4 protein [Clostridia bacterium]